MGWQGEHGKFGFLWGRTHFTMMPDAPVTFRGASVGDDQSVRGLRRKGSLDTWLQGIAPIQRYPKVLLGFYAAFVPPLLDILDCSNFIADWGSRTSTGKTTVLRIATSVFGNPNEDAADSALGSWDTTRVAVERMCALMSGLPVVLDDTRKAKKFNEVGETLYVVASGQGRGRGNKEGRDLLHSWRTVLLSTGEAPAISFTTAAGVRGRVLTIRGLPFDSASDADLIHSLNTVVTANYGHAMPLFLQAILDQREQWSAWQDAYRQERDRIQRLGNNNVATRLSAYCAAICVTAKLVHQLFEEAGHPLPWSYDGQLESLWRTLMAETDDAAVDVRALEDVRSWTASNDAKFYGSPTSEKSMYGPAEPSGGWLGRMLGDGRIAFYPDKLREYLIRQEYHAEEVLGGWKERKWLDLDSEGKNKQITVPGGGKVRMVVLRNEVWSGDEASAQRGEAGATSQTTDNQTNEMNTTPTPAKTAQRVPSEEERLTREFAEATATLNALLKQVGKADEEFASPAWNSNTRSEAFDAAYPGLMTEYRQATKHKRELEYALMESRAAARGRAHEAVADEEGESPDEGGDGEDEEDDYYENYHDSDGEEFNPFRF